MADRFSPCFSWAAWAVWAKQLFLVKTPHPTTERHGKLDDERTGLPGLPDWRGVYLLVAGSFLLWVGLLWGLSRLYS